MAQTIELETDRLRLRQWQEGDFGPFAEMNADPRVMEFFPAALSRAGSDALAQRCHSLIAERGWGLWATELKSTGEFVGFAGLHIPSPEFPFSPCVEVGWRLAFRFWGRGYATEGGRAALYVAFRLLNEKEVISFTSVGNVRSRGVMERLGMRAAGLFDHPNVPEETELRQHCLYRLPVRDYDAQQPPAPGARPPALRLPVSRR
ncbi:MAG: GNAT family N-acetyltransferase [Burkholderiales bacterium]